MASPADAFDRRNLLTYLSLLLGVGAVVAAHAHRSSLAGFAIALAVICDTFDGRFARRFGADPVRRALGAQLDSLADAIAFGLAPPLCAAMLLADAWDPVGTALWGVTFVHAACAVTRLAAFNVTADAGHFVGIPVPLAALVWSTALLVQPTAAVTVGLLLVTAAAMVVPFRVPRPTGAGLALFTCWPLGVALAHFAFGLLRP